MALAERVHKEKLDKEWVELIMAARALGLERDVIRDVLGTLPKWDNGARRLQQEPSISD
ncbi:antirepressor SinI [Paenibacillus nasutitermitis]|nr:antirepressor SinI [Paenibacillus nasutitermitis]